MSIFTPLRYPGGKGVLSSFVKSLIRHNNLCDGSYVEPYAGGAAIALSLLLEGYVWDVVINDVDRAVYAFWWAILNDAESLLRKVRDTDVTIATWESQKRIYSHQGDHSLSDVGFATFFLNRTNRSGILQGGVIGGKKQDGPYKLTARYNKSDLMSRIQLIAQYKNRIQLYNRDAFDLVTSLIPTIHSKTLIYFDPPYFRKGKLLYKNCYELQDHARVASLIQSLHVPWIVTYDNVEEIRELYSRENCVEFNISYSANRERQRGSEIMYYRNIYLPTAPYTKKLAVNRRSENVLPTAC